MAPVTDSIKLNSTYNNPVFVCITWCKSETCVLLLKSDTNSYNSYFFPITFVSKSRQKSDQNGKNYQKNQTLKNIGHHFRKTYKCSHA